LTLSVRSRLVKDLVAPTRGTMVSRSTGMRQRPLRYAAPASAAGTDRAAVETIGHGEPAELQETMRTLTGHLVLLECQTVM